jgi:hypothetical protein
MLRPRVRGGRLGSPAPMSMSKVRVDGSEVSLGNTLRSLSNGPRERRVGGERSCTYSSDMSRLRGGQKLLGGRSLRLQRNAVYTERDIVNALVTEGA